MSIKTILHPPQVKLVIRVGVTGHRPDGLREADIDILTNRSREVLAEISDMARIIYNDTIGYYEGTEPVLRLISPLAEGSDRLVAYAAIDLGYELQCPLPFIKKDYEKDFITSESKNEFNDLVKQATQILEIDGQILTRNAAYHAAGKMVLNQSDVLIAIWDGDETVIAEGGTSQIVQEAKETRMPIVWINAKPEHDVRLINSSKPWKIGLREYLNGILMPDESSTMIQAYLAEKQRKFNWGFPYIFFRNLLGDSKLQIPQLLLSDYEQATQSEWQKDMWGKSADFPPKMKQQIENGFMKYYAWADKLADYYANLYRTSFITTYLFSGLAVLCALLPYAMHSSHSITATTTEVFLIFFIIMLTVLANKKQWHKRWIDYRMLAEILRSMRFLVPIGQVVSSFRVPAHNSIDDIEHSWVNWYYSAIVRQAGLMDMRIDSEYLTEYLSILKQGEVKGQKSFHEINKERYHRICHRLHNTGTALFVITFAAAFAHLFYHGAYSHLLTVVAAVLPAFGAAFAGILFQGEFERLKQRSQAMHHKLQELYTVDDQAISSLSELQRFAMDCSDCMLSEVLDWHYMFKIRSLKLPG